MDHYKEDQMPGILVYGDKGIVSPIVSRIVCRLCLVYNQLTYFLIRFIDLWTELRLISNCRLRDLKSPI